MSRVKHARQRGPPGQRSHSGFSADHSALSLRAPVQALASPVRFEPEESCPSEYLASVQIDGAPFGVLWQYIDKYLWAFVAEHWLN